MTTGNAMNPAKINQRRLECVRGHVARARLDDLLGWYERHKPAVKRVAVYPALLDAINSRYTEAATLGFERTCVHVSGYTRRFGLSYRGFELIPLPE